MHPTFRLEALASLSPHLQSIANTARGATRLADLFTLEHFYDDADDLSVLAPVFYHLLDPARIPTIDGLELEPEAAITRLAAARLAMRAFYRADHDLPEGGEWDVWERIFALLTFVREHRRALPVKFAATELDLLLDFLDFTYKIAQERQDLEREASGVDLSPAVAHLRGRIVAHPGFVALLYRCWKLAMRSEKDVDTFLPYLPPFSSRGSFGFAGPRPSQPEALAEMTVGIITRSHRFDALRVQPDPSGLFRMTPLYRALQPLKIIQLLTRVFRILARPSDGTRTQPSRAPDILTVILCELAQMFGAFGKPAALAAFRHELIEAIVDVGQQRMDDIFVRTLTGFIKSILGQFTVYPAVLRSLAVTCLVRAPLPRTLHSEVRKELQAIADVVEEFLAIRKAEEEVENTLYPCSNPRCNVIRDKSAFQMCSGCSSMRYCSRACQRTDWNEGQHRQTCELYSAQRLRIRKIFSAADIRFIESIVYRMVKADRAQLLHAAADVAQSDWRLLAVSTVDLDTAHREIVAYPEESMREHVGQRDALWDDKVARAMRSGGRMELFVAKVRISIQEGVGPGWLVVPLCVSTGYFTRMGRRTAVAGVGAIPRDGASMSQIADFMKAAKAFRQPKNLLEAQRLL
ncbi:MYND-type domain-containing protein [Mycena kentingensis (nom. inval.)]|nr:MYND-type domain-containing protein [Mycena kentingensis (nom. inval.)]